TEFGDPGFRYGESLSEVAGLFLLRLANADVLPFDYERTAETMARYRDELGALADSAGLADSVDLDRIGASIESFRAAAEALNREIRRITSLRRGGLEGADADSLRRVNDLLLQVEQDFLAEEGLPGRPWFRHQLYAPGFYTGYGVKTLPGVREALEQGNVSQARQMTDVLVAAVDSARTPRLSCCPIPHGVGSRTLDTGGRPIGASRRRFPAPRPAPVTSLRSSRGRDPRSRAARLDAAPFSCPHSAEGRWRGHPAHFSNPRAAPGRRCPPSRSPAANTSRTWSASFASSETW
ncbi:MAG: transferrin receptor-like dimerization domain-containing protein, partial [Gemmatimonadota bacterium]